MERFWKVLSLTLLIGIVAALGVGLVFAQDDTPEPPLKGDGRGPWGWGHERGGRLGFLAIDRDEINAKLAEALSLTVEEFEAAIESGETLSSLAEQADVTLEELQTLMQDFRAEALAQAVAEGTITQEQADQMFERMERRGEGCGGKFGGPGGHGSRGGGFGKREGFGVFSSSGGA